MTRITTMLVAGTIAATVAAPVEAQRRMEEPWAADRGDFAISVEVLPRSETGAFVGLWGRVGPGVDLGAEAELSWFQGEQAQEGEQTTNKASRFGAGLSMKWFMAPRSRVTPFLYAHGGVTRIETELEQSFGTSEREGTYAIVRGALGLEWFASPAFSVAGNVGALWRTGEEDLTGVAGTENRIDRELLELFTTGISVSFRF